MAKRRFDKKEKKNQLRINQSIRAPFVRIVGDKIESKIVAISKALETAQKLDMDLVEISPKADPPVCKIIDYKKFVYDQKKKQKAIKSKTQKVVVKELRFGPNTGEHDFDFKLKHARKFLNDGAKVKAFVFFRGRTIIFKDQGQILLLKLAQALEDVGIVEIMPELDGKKMIMIIAPKKNNK
ncbi:MAG: translation initiation factor IF-3 [Flavobacteriales bacterium]|nr:translation initiation factor IF-3 [Flavobacteriales bacterium]MBH69739.1 translation initiation factor IF-3 [Flavobacteriales bacterium]MBO98232.1 translation initiation factor IF-3 [Flavobacteriales bacterium]